MKIMVIGSPAHDLGKTEMLLKILRDMSEEEVLDVIYCGDFREAGLVVATEMLHECMAAIQVENDVPVAILGTGMQGLSVEERNALFAATIEPTPVELPFLAMDYEAIHAPVFWEPRHKPKWRPDPWKHTRGKQGKNTLCSRRRR